MIHVVLDTTVFTADKKRIKGPFRALTRLLRGRILHLHLPYLVKYEFISQQRANIKGHIHAVRQAAGRIKDESTDPYLTEYAELCDSGGHELKGKISERVEQEFCQWIDDCHATVHECGADHAQRVVESYFKGLAPFKQAKNRNDFPDAFIWRILLEINVLFRPLRFVSHDGTMYDSASKCGIESFKSLEAFIDSSECKNALIQLGDVTTAENANRIALLFQRKKEDAEKMVRRSLAHLVKGETISGDTILSGSREGTIQAVTNIHSVVFQFERNEYYGEGEFGVPFTAYVTCAVTYAIGHMRYIFGERDQGKKIKIVDQSDDAVTVGQEFQLAINGILSIALDRKGIAHENLSDEDLLKLIPNESFGVDILEITVIGPS